MRMTKQQTEEFVWTCGRSEWLECPRSYKKALRCALIALGYDEDWVNGEFREFLDEFGEEYYEG